VNYSSFVNGTYGDNFFGVILFLTSLCFNFSDIWARAVFLLPNLVITGLLLNADPWVVFGRMLLLDRRSFEGPLGDLLEVPFLSTELRLNIELDLITFRPKGNSINMKEQVI
jgi:hypothetical protein